MTEFSGKVAIITGRVGTTGLGRDTGILRRRRALGAELRR